MSEVADHLFTTRHLPLRGGSDEEAAGWAALAAAMQVAPDCLVRARQVHGTAARIVHRGPSEPETLAHQSAVDSLATNDPDVALAVQVADCVPILVADPDTRTVAAIHAGWRGTAAGIAGVIVRQLETQFQARPNALVAAVGPSIGPCCYRVGRDVLDAFRDAGHGSSDTEAWFQCEHDDAYYLDLWRANRDQLEAAGVARDRIHVASLCTATELRWFHSYRVEGRGTGRQAAVIRARRV